MMLIHDAVCMLRQTQIRHKKPWLVLGKGPTLAKLTPAIAAAHSVVALNHAIEVVPRPYVSPVIAHFTDIEAIGGCILAITRGRPKVVMPWHPHVAMEPGLFTVANHSDGHSASAIVIGDLIDSESLWSYNSDRADHLEAHPELTRVRVRAFSAVAAFNLLALADVKEIFSLGVDGGKDYDTRMDAVNKLANGQKSFDAQTPELTRTLLKHSIRWIKL